MKRLLKKDSGQVTIEFIFSFSFALMFLVFFLYFAFNYTVGYIVHYATYSASRAYLSYDTAQRNPDLSIEAAKKYARDEFAKYPLKSFKVKSKNGIEFNDPNAGFIYEYVGAWFSFTPPFVPEDADGKRPEYRSESFLGKEPTRAECSCQVLEQIGGFNCGGGIMPIIEDEVTIFDNGC